MGMANADGKTQVWPKAWFNKKDARRDLMKNAPDGASRYLTRSPFLQKHILNKIPCSILHIPYPIFHIPGASIHEQIEHSAAEGRQFVA